MDEQTFALLKSWSLPIILSYRGKNGAVQIAIINICCNKYYKLSGNNPEYFFWYEIWMYFFPVKCKFKEGKL